MNRLPAQFIQLDITTPLIDALPPGKGCWLVGGALRDDILGKAAGDFDLAFDFDPTDFARALAARLRGTFVPLDPVRNQSRVVFSSGGARHTLDFAPLRASSLGEDLALRDFSCNAMACDLKKPEALIDPLSGERDLLDGILRACSGNVLRDDPLRVLKGVRHAVELNLEIDEDTCRQIIKHRDLLRNVARERITAEFGRIFSHSQVHIGASMLNKFDLLNGLSCSREYSMNIEGLHQLLASERRLEDAGLFPELMTPIEDNWPLYAVARLCRTVIEGDSSSSGDPFGFLKQSRKAVAIAKMLKGLSGLELSSEITLHTPRKRALWLDQFQSSPPAAALFGSSFMHLAALNPVACLADWLELQEEGKVSDLLTPKELIEQWGIEPGVGIGEGLTAIRRDEISGRISLPFQPEELVAKYFKRD